MLKKARYGIQPRILIMFLFLSMVPLLVSIWIIFKHSEMVYFESQGKEMSNIADMAANQLINHLKDVSSQVDTLSFNPLVVEMLNDRKTAVGTNNTSAIKRALEIEKIWLGLTPKDPAVTKIVENPLADYLKKFITIHNIFKEITLLDNRGIVLASTNITEHYYYGNEVWIPKVIQHYIDYGAYISDIKYNEIFKSYSIEIVVPVFDQNRSCMGMLKCILRITDIDNVIRPFKFGRTGQAIVMSSDGTIISSQQLDLTDQVTYDFFGQILPILQNQKLNYGRIYKKGKLVRIIGTTNIKLTNSYPKLKWYVFTEENPKEALSAVYGIKNMAISYVIIVLIVIIFVSFWFSRILTKPIVDMDLHFDKL